MRLQRPNRRNSANFIVLDKVSFRVHCCARLLWDLYDETLAFPSLGVFGLLKGVSVSAASANKCVVRRTALYRSHALRFTQRRISTMSKMRNVVVAFALSVLTVPLAFSQEHGNAGCKNGKFIGSYTHLDTIAD